MPACSSVWLVCGLAGAWNVGATAPVSSCKHEGKGKCWDPPRSQTLILQSTRKRLIQLKAAMQTEEAEVERAYGSFPLEDECAGTYCGWTLDYNCPGQPKGKKGSAGDDGSIGRKCCCERGMWKDSLVVEQRFCKDFRYGGYPFRDGKFKTCAWYKADPSLRCKSDKARDFRTGRSVQQVCCTCGGGYKADCPFYPKATSYGKCPCPKGALKVEITRNQETLYTCKWTPGWSKCWRDGYGQMWYGCVIKPPGKDYQIKASRDECIKRDCAAKGLTYTGRYEDCGDWEFKGWCE